MTTTGKPNFTESNSTTHPRQTGDRVIALAGETLRPISRALYWPRAQTLYVADLHIGKAATFRSLGIPVPEAAAEHDLAELADLIAAIRERAPVIRLVILGDLIHARRGRGPELESRLADWFRAVRTGGDLTAILVRGNHDRSAGDPPPSWGIETIPEGTPDADAGGPADSPFILAHEPPPPNSPDPRGPVLCGHVHPGMRFRDFGFRTVRVPCFHLSNHCNAGTGEGCCLTLPAWTRFSGAHTIRPCETDRCWPVLEGQVSPSFGART